MTVQSKDWFRENLVVISFIVGIFAQTSTLVWYISAMESRLSALEKSDQSQQAFPERIKGLETAGDDVSRRLDRIELKIDRILEERAAVRVEERDVRPTK